MNAPQLTITALYGPKEEAFGQFIEGIWQEIERSPLRTYFQPYQLKQVHATIIGMERAHNKEGLINANTWLEENREAPMKLAGTYSTLAPYFPLRVQFGGWQPEDSPFLSFDTRPYARSFQLHWAAKRVTIAGWPTAGAPLWELRKKMDEKHNIRHKYHRHQDNDFYLVLGTLSSPVLASASERQELENTNRILTKAVRQRLARHPQKFTIGLDSLSPIRYRDPTLPAASTEKWPIHWLKDSSKMEGLYFED